MEVKTQKFTALHLCAAAVVIIMTTTLATVSAAEENDVATAVFGGSGVTGWIRFFQYDDRITILVNMVGFKSNASWSIHQLPVDLTLSPSEKCSEDYLGPIYDPYDEYNATLCSEEDPISCAGDLGEIYGTIDDTPQLFNDSESFITLRGPYSIVGRSIIVEHSEGLLCATIRSNVEKELTKDEIVTLKATFISPLAGTVYFRQAKDQSTTIFGKLFWVNGNDMTVDHNWAIFNERVTEEYRQGNCSTLASHYDPFMVGPTSRPGYDENCTSDSMDRCEVGDLSGKHSMIHIDGNPAPYSELAFFFTDTNLMLSGMSGINGLVLGIYNTAEEGSDIVACAPIVHSELIEATLYPDLYFTAMQASPYENSTMKFGSNLPMGDHSILESALMTNTPCPVDEEPFDPFNVGSNGASSPIAKRTPDQYPLGALTEKYDYLVSPSTTLNVPDLPLYGQNTILGRTFRTVIKSSNTSTKRICSALVPVDNGQNIIAKVSLIHSNKNVTGTIYFVQNQNPLLSGEPGITSIITNVYSTNQEDTTKKNSSHIWILSESDDEDYCSDGGSMFAYNPFDVSIDLEHYFNDCSPKSPLRCIYGHFTGKHGKVPIDTTAVYQDPHVQLDGLYSAIGKYVSIVSDLDVVLACGKIEQVALNTYDDIIVAFPENERYDQTPFTSLYESLVLHEEVGFLKTLDDTPCVVQYMKVTAPTVEEANLLAEVAQNTSCVMHGDNACMKQLSVCGDEFGSDGTTMIPSEGSATTPDDGTLMPTDGMTTRTTDAATEDPPASTDNPPASTDGPSASTDGPPSSTDGPTSSTDGPPSSTDGPTSSTDSPTSSTDGPPSSTDGPTSSTDGPTSSTDGPPASTDGPTASTPMSTDSTFDGLSKTATTVTVDDTDSPTTGTSACITITPLSFTLSVLLTVIISRVIV